MLLKLTIKYPHRPWLGEAEDKRKIGEVEWDSERGELLGQGPTAKNLMDEAHRARRAGFVWLPDPPPAWERRPVRDPLRVPADMAALLASQRYVVPDELKPYFKPAFDGVEFAPLPPGAVA